MMKAVKETLIKSDAQIAPQIFRHIVQIECRRDLYDPVEKMQVRCAPVI